MTLAGAATLVLIRIPHTKRGAKSVWGKKKTRLKQRATHTAAVITRPLPEKTMWGCLKGKPLHLVFMVAKKSLRERLPGEPPPYTVGHNSLIGGVFTWETFTSYGAWASHASEKSRRATAFKKLLGLPHETHATTPVPLGLFRDNVLQNNREDKQQRGKKKLWRHILHSCDTSSKNGGGLSVGTSLGVFAFPSPRCGRKSRAYPRSCMTRPADRARMFLHNIVGRVGPGQEEFETSRVRSS